MGSDTCPGSDHRAPRSGGACACGMVTLVPARSLGSHAGIRELLARCLDDHDDDHDARPSGTGAVDSVAHGSPVASVGPGRQVRADRLLAALAEAGLVVTSRGEPTVPV